MSTPTVNSILRAIADFESQTSERPRYLYLGFEDWHALRDYYLQHYGFDLTPANNRFQGFEILYVNKPRHLAVG